MLTKLDYIAVSVAFATLAAAYLAAQGLVPLFISDEVRFFIWSRLAPPVVMVSTVILLRRRIRW